MTNIVSSRRVRIESAGERRVGCANLDLHMESLELQSFQKELYPLPKCLDRFFDEV